LQDFFEKRIKKHPGATVFGGVGKGMLRHRLKLRIRTFLSGEKKGSYVSPKKPISKALEDVCLQEYEKNTPKPRFRGESEATPHSHIKKCVAARIHFGQKTPFTVFLAPTGKREKFALFCANPVRGSCSAEGA
jgi:hypothetical protein